ncbi:transporter [Eudoraea chungangensis]|uniref:transporter n=1 Tax=Eudoraea chungangensis TaxID=1481905 RepID=UPI0023EB99CC|nr:transporter [Eudoraea chungangensis]
MYRQASTNPFTITIYLIVLIIPFIGVCQYTDVINSNRPGVSVSAYAIGKGVVQAELGLGYEIENHSLLNTDANSFAVDFSFRYGLLLEKLELNWEGRYQNQNITYNEFGFSATRSNFSRNRIGLKYLIYDPFANPQRNKPNLYSWRANHKFQFKNLLPAVSLYAGANFSFGDNPFYPEDPEISPRAMIATQSRLTPRFVLITNIAYDKIGTDFPEWSYTISLSHALRNPKWSVFAENQGISGDRYSDVLLRAGSAYLFNENFQVDAALGGSFKNTPTKFFGTIGASYRLDFHKDVLIPIEDQNADENGGQIERNAMKKKKDKKQKKKKNKGSGAEDVDLGPSKKEMRQLKKKKKEIEF